MGEKGMTFTEVAISLAITAAMSVFLGTELEALADRVRFDAAVTEVIGDLRYARTLAVREQQTVQVAVNQEQPGIAILRPGAPSEPVGPTKNLASRGVRTIRSSGGSLLSFSPRGTSATPTTLTLEDRRGARRVVTLSLTGIARAR
jgi:hypothetical protein